MLLITAYVCMMRSPTILSVLPEGGDSRKQVMMVFVLAVIGCAVFTAYAAGLFFRQKSRETGVFLALGATRRQLQREMGKELAVISLGSCAAGAALGGPLAWGVWQLFRLFLVDSQEMALSFDPRSYLLSMVFAAYVVGMLFFLGGRSIRRTNIIDIVQESHKSEPIREVKRWYGSVGIVLVVIGALAGYLMPSFFVTVLQWYPPSGVEAVFYLPALVGMYMILLHTVVNGWRKRHKYRDIIATSMMKFQGRQTVRNMLVMTLLIAGAYFASFYAPMLNTSSTYSFSTRPVDFEYHWRNDQNWPERGEVESLASKHGVDITSWTQVDAATLGCDGTVSIEQSAGALGTTYTKEYREIQGGATYFSESAWNALTGQAVDLAPGTCANVLDDEGGSDYLSGGDVTLITNMVTRKALRVIPAEPLCFTMLLGSYVLESASDSEYTLTKEELALVDMEDFYIELRADGTGETYMEDFVTFQWKDGSFYALTDPDTPAMTYTREGDLLTIEYDGMTMVFKRSDTKPEIDPALLDGGDDEYDGDGWIDGPDEPDPPYTYDDGNTYDDLGNTNWYGWFRMENYKNVPNRDYFDTDTYDCWGYIGESDDGSHYFEVYRDGMPDDPVITMWVNVYDDHIEPILDGYDWVLDQNITESDAYKFNLYPYNDSISLFMYDYEGDDGTACAVSFYMRLDGTEWNEELEELPPRYEEYKAALANK